MAAGRVLDGADLAGLVEQAISLALGKGRSQDVIDTGVPAQFDRAVSARGPQGSVKGQQQQNASQVAPEPAGARRGPTTLQPRLAVRPKLQQPALPCS